MQNSGLHLLKTRVVAQQCLFNGCSSVCVTDVHNGSQWCVWPQMHSDTLADTCTQICATNNTSGTGEKSYAAQHADGCCQLFGFMQVLKIHEVHSMKEGK